MGNTDLIMEDDYRTALFNKTCKLASVIAVGTAPEDAPITLASGKKSNYYVNARVLFAHPKGFRWAGRLPWHAVRNLHADYIGGMETGAIAVYTSILPHVSDGQVDKLRGFSVKKEEKGKDHGIAGRFAALRKGESLKGKKVVVVEDTTTTGGSLLKAVEVVAEAGGIVQHVVTLFDREEGGREAIEPHGLVFHAVIPVRTNAHLLLPEGFVPKTWG